ncbi:MAG: helix-turn-helix domain-containing protein [Firmicutes bacterium]|nr:helix-turn-helix domain-containing protein [Bacillota bacterium]
MYKSTNVAEIIKKTAKVKNIQLKDMLIELELNKNTLSNMYKGSMLKGDSLARIADYLDVSVDYLLGRTNEQISTYYSNNVKGINFSNLIQGGSSVTVNSNKNDYSDLSKEEIGILNVYRSLDIRDRVKFMNFVFDMEDKATKA